MKILKIVYKFLCFASLFIVIMSIKNTSIVTVTKATNTNPNKNLNLNAMARLINTFRDNDINYPKDTYNGIITGYVANCPACSGKLGCTGKNVLDGTTTYLDQTYGTVRIVASSSNLACGSIVRFNLNSISEETITAIVLDRGVTGTALDLLVDNIDTATAKVGSQRITYDVLRFGY